MPNVEIESVSDNGLRRLKVTDSVLSTDEIKYLDLKRKYLDTTYGAGAKDWPVMVDLAIQRALFLIDRSSEYEQIPFADLR